MTSLCDVWWCSNTIACPVPSPRERKATLERHPLSQKKKLFTSASTLLRLNRIKQILRWNHQAIELTLPPSLKPVNIFLAWNVANKLLQFARRSWTPLLRLSSPQRRTGKLKKIISLLWKISLPRHSLLVAFRNSKTRRHSKIKQTRPSTKQDFSGEALSKQNTKASLASLSCNSSQAPTEWSAIFAFGV